MITLKIFLSTLQRGTISEVISIGAGQVFAALGSIVAVKVLTGYLSPSEYGEIALGLTAAVLVSQVILGPLSQASLRHYSSASESEELGEFIRSLVWITLWVLMSFVILTVVTALPIHFYYEQWLLLAIGSVFFAFIQGLNGILDNIQNAARKRITVAFHIGGAIWLRLGVALLLITIFGPTSESVIIGYLLGALLILISEIIFFHINIIPLKELRGLRMGPEKIWRRKILNYAWPFTAWGIFTFIQQASDRWALGIIISASAVGMYTVLFQLSAYPILFLSGIVSQIFEPVIFKRSGDGNQFRSLRASDQLILWLVIGSLVTTILLSTGAIIFHEIIFNLLVGEEYQSVSFLMPLMVASGGIFVTGQMSTLYLTTRNHTRQLIIPKVTTAMIGIILNVLGATYLGITGVVFSQVLFSLIYFGWIIFIAKRHV